VTVSTDDSAPATKATAAQVGIFTATSNGKDEYSIFVAPALAQKIQDVVYNTSLSDDQPETVTKRGLPVPAPASILRGLIDLVGPELAAAFIDTFDLAGGKTSLAALGATAAGFVPVIGAAIEFGGVLYSAVSVLELYAKMYINFRTIDRQPLKGFPASVVIDLSKLPSSQKDCAKTIECVDCGGVNGVCTTSNQGCKSRLPRSHPPTCTDNN
jgi:hypothetical protein